MESRTEIESLVRERRSEAAHEAIRRYLKERNDDVHALIQASDWYRRLGWYAQGLRVLRQGDSLSATGDRDKIRLTAAHLLNQSGASQLALKLISKAAPAEPEHDRIAGIIALDNFEFSAAREYLERFHRRDPNPGSYSSRIAKVALADALADEGRWKEAIAIVDSLPVASDETLLAAIRMQALGEYLAIGGDFPESLIKLETALRLFPSEENTTDRGILLKWLAYGYGRRGELARARDLFSQARGLLRKPGLRLEMFFHLQLLRHEIFPLKRRVLERILHYPGSGPGFARFMNRRVKRPLEDARFGSDDAPIILHLDRDEYQIRGKPSLGIPLELRLAGALAVAGRWGISLVRIKSTLWPEEIFRFFEIDTRVHALVRRLRSQYGLRARVGKGSIRLKQRSLAQIQVVRSKDRRPAYLASHAVVRRAELSARYGLSSTQAKQWITRWIDEGWLKSQGRGPSTIYLRRDF